MEVTPDLKSDNVTKVQCNAAMQQYSCYSIQCHHIRIKNRTWINQAVNLQQLIMFILRFTRQSFILILSYTNADLLHFCVTTSQRKRIRLVDAV